MQSAVCVNKREHGRLGNGANNPEWLSSVKGREISNMMRNKARRRAETCPMPIAPVVRKPCRHQLTHARLLRKKMQQRKRLGVPVRPSTRENKRKKEKEKRKKRKKKGGYL
jgi:hypothetical protein